MKNVSKSLVLFSIAVILYGNNEATPASRLLAAAVEELSKALECRTRLLQILKSSIRNDTIFSSLEQDDALSHLFSYNVRNQSGMLYVILYIKQQAQTIHSNALGYSQLCDRLKLVGMKPQEINNLRKAHHIEADVFSGVRVVRIFC